MPSSTRRNNKHIAKGEFFAALVLTVCFLIVSALPMLAQSLTATVNAKEITQNGRLQLTFTLSDAQGGNFQPPELADWAVLSGPATSTNMQIINGVMSQSVSYSYILQPKKTGKLTIGAASVVIGGKTYSSKPLTVSVTEKAAGGAKSEDEEISSFINENAFIKATISKRTALQGEQITIAYKLYTRLQLFNLTLESTPAFTGFWMEEQPTDPNAGFVQEVYEGVRYNALELKKYILYPQKSGTLTIEPLSIKSTARLQLQNQQRRSVFDDFFARTQDVPHILKSRAETVEVQPLPGNPPNGFYGAVGNYKLTVKSNKTETETGDPFTITITISGTGNLKTVQPPKLNLPADFEVYDPKIKETGGISSGSRIYDYLVIPRTPGEYSVPPVDFSYFNLSTKKYESLSSESFTIKVTGTAIAGTTPIAGVAQKELSLLGSDIRFVKEVVALEQSGNRLWGSVVFWLLTVLPISIPFVLFFVMKRKGDSSDEPSAKKARYIVNKRIKKAQELQAQGKHSEAVAEIRTATEEFLSMVYNIPLAQLSKDSLSELAIKQPQFAQVLQRFSELIERCELALYAPSAPGADIPSLATDLSTAVQEASRA